MYVLFLLLSYASWFRGGTYVPVQPWTFGMGLLVLASVFLLPRFFSGAGSVPRLLPARASHSLRDPIFYLGMAFLLFLTIQWWNAGRKLFFDSVAWKWAYSEPRIPWLPSAVNADEALQMLYWFVPAWAVLLITRGARLGSAAARGLYTLLAVNAGLLALFGIIQYASGTTALYWAQPMGSHFFASFGYSNHAAAFFLLMLAISAGLALDCLFSTHRRTSRALLIVTFLTALLSLGGVCLSFCLFPTVLACLLAGGAIVCAFILAWRRLGPVGRLRVVLGGIVLACVAYLLMIGLYRISADRAYYSMWELREPHLLKLKYDERAFLTKPAVTIWKENPWYGVGGWGYRHFLVTHIDPNSARALQPGYANVHNDPLQFLVEFGAIGGGLMLAMLSVLAADVYRSGAWRRPIAAMPLFGAWVVLLYSLMDIPFRCPAILYCWLAVLAAAPGFVLREVRNTDGAT